MQAVASLVEDLEKAGVAVPPFPSIEVPPVLKRKEWSAGPTDEEVEQDRQFQAAIHAWRDAIRALHAQHFAPARKGESPPSEED